MVAGPPPPGSIWWRRNWWRRSAGRATGARRRRAWRRSSVALLDAPVEAENLARRLLDVGAVPREAAADAAHIAIVAANGVEYLVTWNFRHIANAAMRVRIERACRAAGYQPPVICTTNELMETSHADDGD